MPFRRLFVDIETSPNVGYFWQSGYRQSIPYQNIKKERAIICICWKWADTKGIESLTWKDGDDGPMLRKFVKMLKDADEIVTHNGDMFDLPHIRTRCLFNGIPIAETFTSVDTLRIARHRFKFNSNRLDYLGRFLGLGTKIQNPPDLWDRVMEGQKSALSDMVTYCKRDVSLLEAVHDKLTGYSRAATHLGVATGSDRLSCPHCGGTHTKVDKTTTTAVGTLRRQMNCKGCGRYWTVADGTYRGVMAARKLEEKRAQLMKDLRGK